MEKNPESSWGPSFLKVLLQDYTMRLRLPPVFVRDYGPFLSKNVKFITSLGKWEVKIKEEICNDDAKYLCFVGEGWRKFVKDLDLKLGEFVMFILNNGNSTFGVSVFGLNFCERVLRGNSRFRTTIRYYNKHLMDIPKAFAKEAGITSKRYIKLVNSKGKEWAVELYLMKYGRLRMSKGWSNFYIENKIVLGSKCVFEFDPISEKMIVKIEERSSEIGSEGSRESMRTPTKRGRGVRRGRPFKNVMDLETDSDGEFEGISTDIEDSESNDDNDNDGDVKCMIKNHNSYGSGGSTESIRIPTKRGRGRPRKTSSFILPTSIGVGATENMTTPVKRGRGRPRKNPHIILPTTRGRGRGRGMGMGRSWKSPLSLLDDELDSSDDEEDSEFSAGSGRCGGGELHKNKLDMVMESDSDSDFLHVESDEDCDSDSGF